VIDDDLRALRDEIAWPATPDLAAAVAARLAAEPRRRAAPWVLRPAIILPLLVVLLLGAVAAVPPARTAVLDVLGLAARERVVRVERPPAAPPGAMRGPHLGRRVTLARARAAVDFPVRVPALLGPPPEVRLSRRLPGGAVTLLYGTRYALTEFRGGATPFALKSVGPGTRAIDARVGGHRAIFLTGAPFAWVALDRNGRPVESTARLVGANVLLFDAGGLGFRLETTAGLARALAVARSLDVR
jgi:hypothetical protein